MCFALMLCKYKARFASVQVFSKKKVFFFEWLRLVFCYLFVFQWFMRSKIIVFFYDKIYLSFGKTK